MPDTPITNRAGRSLTQLILIGLVLQVSVVGYVFVTSYSGRKALVASQRGGCERSKLDRLANAQGWRNAEKARRADGQIALADEYARIAHGLEKRGRIVCSTVFPKASLLP